MFILPDNICASLAAHGCKIAPQQYFLNGFAFVKPVSIGANLRLYQALFGSYCCIAANSIFTDVQVGCYSSIGENFFGVAGAHVMTDLTTSPVLYGHFVFTNKFYVKLYANPAIEEPMLKIGNDVVIKKGVSILHGVQVGHGAVIEDGAIITKDVPPYAIVRGVNQVIGQRFSDEIVADLLEFQWWRYDLPALIADGIQVPLNNPQELMQFIQDQEPSNLPLTSHIAHSVSISDNVLELTDFSLEQFKSFSK